MLSLTGCVGLACWTGLGQFGLRLSLIGLMALVGKSNAGLGLEQGFTGFGFRFVLGCIWD